MPVYNEKELVFWDGILRSQILARWKSKRLKKLRV